MLEEDDLKEDVEKKLANLIGQSMKAQKEALYEDEKNRPVSGNAAVDYSSL